MKRFKGDRWDEVFLDATEQGAKKLGNRGQRGMLTASPVVILMTYAYFFEHDRYEWHLDLNGDSLDNHNKRFVGTPFNISRLDLTPELHFTIHISYTGRAIEKLTNSVCHAHKAKDALNVPSHCKNLERPHMDLFLFNNARNHFEGWCCGKEGRKLCETLIRKHYEDVGRVLRSNNRLFNTSHVRVIENIASEHFQTQCSPFLY